MSILDILQQLYDENYIVEVTTDSGVSYKGNIVQISETILMLRATINGGRVLHSIVAISAIEGVEYMSDKGDPPAHAFVLNESNPENE